MNTSMSRDVQHSQSIYPLSVASQFIAPEIFLNLRTLFAMIKTLQFQIIIIMVEQWFKMVKRLLFTIHELVYKVYIYPHYIHLILEENGDIINLNWLLVKFKRVILQLNSIKSIKNMFADAKKIYGVDYI
eukprot:322546_1